MHHYSLFPHCTGTVSPMVNRNTIHSFVLFVVALFFQQSRFPVWTKVPKYAILNNLAKGDSKNIHFMATCESVYLRQQRQTLERGEVRFQRKKKKNHNIILWETKGETREWNKMEIAFLWCQRLTLSLTLGGCVWVFYLSCLTQLSRWNQATAFIFLCLLWSDLFSCFICLAGCLNEESTFTPLKFINTSDVTIWFTICPHVVNIHILC